MVSILFVELREGIVQSVRFFLRIQDSEYEESVHLNTPTRFVWLETKIRYFFLRNALKVRSNQSPGLECHVLSALMQVY